MTIIKRVISKIKKTLNFLIKRTSRELFISNFADKLLKENNHQPLKKKMASYKLFPLK